MDDDHLGTIYGRTLTDRIGYACVPVPQGDAHPLATFCRLNVLRRRGGPRSGWSVHYPHPWLPTETECLGGLASAGNQEYPLSRSLPPRRASPTQPIPHHPAHVYSLLLLDVAAGTEGDGAQGGGRR